MLVISGLNTGKFGYERICYGFKDGICILALVTSRIFGLRVLENRCKLPKGNGRLMQANYVKGSLLDS